MSEIPKWPGPGSEEWWWRETSPGMRDAYIRAHAWGKRKQEENRRREAETEERLENARTRRVLMTDREHEDWKARNPLFIRFGDRPRSWRYGGRSLAEAHGKRPNPKLEKGISCFRGRQEEDGSYTIDVSASPPQLEMYKMVAREGRSVYLLTGQDVEEGSDGEPVVVDAEFTPLPEGTLVRCSGHWQKMVNLTYSLRWLQTLGMVSIPSWAYEPAKEIRVGALDSEGEALQLPTPADVPAVLGAVLERSTSKETLTHGPEHWRRVAIAGARLLEETPDADRLVVFLFAVLHDAFRIYDTYDAWHGWRAAEFARELLKGGAIISEEQLETLAFALEMHDEGEVSDNPTVGVAWDADRLLLWRVGIEPKPELLSTRAAKKPETIAWARGLGGQSFTWGKVLALYGLAEQETERKETT